MASVVGFALAALTVGAEITLQVTEPGVPWSRSDVLHVEARAYAAEGYQEQSQSENLRWASQPGKTGDRDGTVSLRMDLAPGYHQLRVAVRSAALGTTASVFADVDVPDFAGNLVSLSGVVLRPAASPNSAAALPTTSRTFATSDRIDASLSIYQGARGPVSPVTISTRIVNAHDETVFSRSDVVDVDRFVTTNHRADWSVDLPLALLPPGTCLLVIDAAAGAQHAERDVRFDVR